LPFEASQNPGYHYSMKTTDNLTKARKAVRNAIPGGYLAITDPLFAGERKLYCAVSPDGTIEAQDHTTTGLSKQVRSMGKRASGDRR